MIAKESAPGKIIISGEYSILDGASAIVMPTHQKATITIKEIKKKENVFYTSAINQPFNFKISKDLSVIWTDTKPGHYSFFVDAIFKQLKIASTKKISISIETKDFYKDEIKLGIGSSSAIAVAIIKACNQFYNLKMDSSQLLKNALDLHSKTQNFRGSGIDIACSFFGKGIIQTKMNSIKEQNWREIVWPKGLHMEVLFTQKSISTKSMVERYIDAKKRDNNKEIIKGLVKVSEDITSYWSNQDIANVINALKEYDAMMREMDVLSKLGIFSNVHNQIYLIAKKHNVFYKPSGAGHSDIGLAFSQSLLEMSGFLEEMRSLRDHPLIIKAI